jgi:hypothetical protein
VGESSLVFQRAETLELVDLDSRRFEVKSRQGATVNALNVSVRGGLVAAVSSEGGVEIVRDGRVYGLGRTGLLPIRVFELPGTRGVLEVNSSGLVRAVDYRTGRELYRWQAAPTPLRAAFFSTGAHRLSVLTTAGSLHVWDVSGLEAAEVDESRRAASATAPSVTGTRPSVVLEAIAGGGAPAIDEQRAVVLVDSQTDLAVLRGARDAILLFRGEPYRMRDFMALTSTRTTDGGSWLLTDGRRIIRLVRLSSPNSRPDRPEILWEGGRNDVVERMLALEEGGVAVVLRNSIALLNAQGVERVRLSRETTVQQIEGELVRARESGDVLTLETTTCGQRRIHVPTSRILYEVSRVCREGS